MISVERLWILAGFESQPRGFKFQSEVHGFSFSNEKSHMLNSLVLSKMGQLVILEQWFPFQWESSGGILPPRGYSAKSGDIFGRENWLGVGGWGDAAGI